MDQVQSSALSRNIDKYLAYQRFTDTLFADEVNAKTGIVVTIPALAEPDLITSLQSLKACELPACRVEVVVVINHSVNASEEDIQLCHQSYAEAKEWADKYSSEQLAFYISPVQALPKKQAGAGLARKVAMDEAVWRLKSSEYENPIIACFDADATVTPNYFIALERRMSESHDAWSINCEHPLVNLSEFDKEAIMQYELHLRYYQAALVYAGHPQAIFTIGSSMAVTRNGYVLQGGMNRRKAGEDFWFMLKIIMAGSVGLIEEATVMPKGRVSTRVPFGTGRAMLEMTQKNSATYLTAPLSTFELVKMMVRSVPEFSKGNYSVTSEVLQQFLDDQNFAEIVDEIRQYTTNYDAFVKRFYRWFNLFMVMKLAHYVRDKGVKDVPVKDEAIRLWRLVDQKNGGVADTLEVLRKYRARKKVKPTDFTL